MKRFQKSLTALALVLACQTTAKASSFTAQEERILDTVTPQALRTVLGAYPASSLDDVAQQINRGVAAGVGSINPGAPNLANAITGVNTLLGGAGTVHARATAVNDILGTGANMGNIHGGGGLAPGLANAATPDAFTKSQAILARLNAVLVAAGIVGVPNNTIEDCLNALEDCFNVLD